MAILPYFGQKMRFAGPVIKGAKLLPRPIKSLGFSYRFELMCLLRTPLRKMKAASSFGAVNESVKKSGFENCSTLQKEIGYEST